MNYSCFRRERLLNEFKKYDADHDGRISFAEFRAMLEGQGYSEKDIEHLFPEADENKDGFLDFEEFKRYLNFQDQHPAELTIEQVE